MAPLTVVLALPFVLWITLAALAGGSFAFVALAGRFTDASRGFLRFTAVMAALLSVLTLLVDAALPAPDSTQAVVLAPAWLETTRRAALALFVVIAVGYAAVVGSRRRQSVAAVAALAIFAVAVCSAALGWARTAADSVPFGLQLFVLSAAAGGGLASLTLGHWYLVTPKISTRPLVVLTLALTAVLALQVALFATWALFGGGVDQDPFEVVTGAGALYGWLRLLITLLFPLLLAAMAWRTALTRSMESATGLLYIAIAAIFAGTVGAATLYVTQGILV